MPIMVGIVGHAPPVDEKVWYFLSAFLSRFGMTKFVITETLWSSVIFKTIMVSLHAVCSCAPCGPPELSLRGKFIPKIAIFCNFWGCKPIFLKPRRWNLACGCGPGTSSPKTNFVKIGSGGIPFLGKFIPNNTNFGDFGGCRPTFLKLQQWNFAWGCEPGTLSPHLIL